MPSNIQSTNCMFRLHENASALVNQIHQIMRAGCTRTRPCLQTSNPPIACSGCMRMLRLGKFNSPIYACRLHEDTTMPQFFQSTKYMFRLHENASALVNQIHQIMRAGCTRTRPCLQTSNPPIACSGCVRTRLP